MINPKRVFEIASKWQNAASLNRRRRSRRYEEGSSSTSSVLKCKVQVAQKGHFVVYSIDKKRFVVPLDYLNHEIFIELFKMSEEEFGLPRTDPIVLPCDVISVVKQHLSKESSFITKVAAHRSSFSPHALRGQQILLPGF